MKKLILSLLLLFTSTGPAAFAEYIDSNLQAVILSEHYPAAAAQARAALEAQAPGDALVLGDTSTLTVSGPEYYFYIPVSGMRVPLSPTEPVRLGSIVAKLHFIPNSPVPGVLAVFFRPAESLPGNNR